MRCGGIGHGWLAGWLARGGGRWVWVWVNSGNRKVRRREERGGSFQGGGVDARGRVAPAATADRYSWRF